MKATVIPIVIGVFGIVTKQLVQRLEDFEIRERVDTLQTTALLRLARILRLAVTQTPLKNQKLTLE